MGKVIRKKGRRYTKTGEAVMAVPDAFSSFGRDIFSLYPRQKRNSASSGNGFSNEAQTSRRFASEDVEKTGII